jgi:hypothetical protein
VEPELFINILSASLEGVAWLGLGGMMLTHCPRMACVGRIALISGLLGLFFVLITAGFCRVGTTLTAGLTVTLLLLLLVHPPCREWHVDPYAHIYAPDESLPANV